MPNLHEFREILIWYMTSDPFPIGSNQFVIGEWLDAVAQNYGFRDWLEAYHQL